MVAFPEISWLVDARQSPDSHTTVAQYTGITCRKENKIGQDVVLEIWCYQIRQDSLELHDSQ